LRPDPLPSDGRGECGDGLVVHFAHAAVAARHWSFLLLFRDFGHEAFGRQQQAPNGSRVLQGSARDFLGINDAGFDQVLIRKSKAMRAASPKSAVPSEILPDGKFHVKAEHLKNGEWTPGHEVTYEEDPASQVVFK